MVEFRPFCGNSSVVEHDLAKVGVASSNLVSRSILILLLFFSSLFSNEVLIDKVYCVEQNVLNASFFGYKGKDDFHILSIPKDRSHYTVSSSQVISLFNDKNISVVDSSEGVIVFKRHCQMMGKQDEIINAFLKKIQEESPYIIIEAKPSISIKSPLPQDFSRYTLTAIFIPDTMLKKNTGSFAALFKIGDKEKKIYFYYTLDAKIEVFKAKHNLLNGKILLNDDYEKVSISLEGLPARAILGEISKNMMIKSYIKEGSIFTENMFETKKDVSKKESIKAFLKEGSLLIEVQATLLEDGNIGETVKIKTEQGKTLNAKILSLKEAMILE